MWEKENVKKAFDAFIEDNHTRLRDSVNGMMDAEFVDSDSMEKSVTLRFRVLPWEGNRAGALHGGIMCAMMDHVCNLTVSYELGHWAPTMSMNTEFIRPADIGDVLLAKAVIVSAGRRVIRLRGELTDEVSGRLVAVCTMSFFNRED